MNRKVLSLVVSIVLVAVVAFVLLRPLLSLQPSETQSEQSRNPSEPANTEGFVAITPQQLVSSQIEVARVQQGSPIELLLPASVATTPTGVARIDARASGIVRSVSKSLGDPVKRGEVVARIESGDAANLAAQLGAARARVNELSAIYDRERRLFTENVTARQDLEAAQTNLAIARAELQRAQAAVTTAGVSKDGRSLAVTSPLSGRITAAPVLLGAFVSAGDELYRVVDPSALQVEAAVPFADVARLQRGDRVSLRLPDGRELAGRIRSITPSVSTENRTATAVISLDGGISGLQPGAFLEAAVRLSGAFDPDRVSVPQDAVQTVKGRDVVFRRVRGGFQAQPVTIGERSGGSVTIVAGLQPGIVIATTNSILLKAELEKEEAEHGH